MLRAAYTFALWAFLVGQAPPAAQPAAGSTLRAADARLAGIAHRIALGARRLCPEPQPVTGMLIHHLADYEPHDQLAMVARYRLDRGPGVLAVVESSAAARAGLIAGDVILSAAGEPLALSTGESGRAARNALEDRLEATLRQGAVALRVFRAGRELELRIEPEAGCPSRVRLARSSQVNGFATARQVVLTTAILDEIQNDDELAVVLGHELAHVILKHPDRLAAAGVPRGLLRGIGANAARVHETEQEADRLGIKLAWAAGYDVRAAIPFWRRFYAKYDGPQLFRTHPGLALRERLIGETLAELEAGAERPELREGTLRQR